MAIYPPIIQGNLPSMVLQKDGSYSLTFSYEIGRNTSTASIKVIKYLIKEVVNNAILYEGRIDEEQTIKNIIAAKQINIEILD